MVDFTLVVIWVSRRANSDNVVDDFSIDDTSNPLAFEQENTLELLEDNNCCTENGLEMPGMDNDIEKMNDQ